MITKWLRNSGLVVNEAKTELCLFSKRYTQMITLVISNNIVKSKNQINFLRVLFDS